MSVEIIEDFQANPPLKMDEKTIIRAVAAHPQLYDNTHPQYKDAERRNDVWRKIAYDLGADGWLRKINLISKKNATYCYLYV